MQSPKGGGKSSAAAIACPARLWADRPLEGRGAVPFRWGASESMAMNPASFPYRLCRQHHETGDILRGKLDPDMCSKRLHAELPEIVVEVLEHGR